MYAVPKANIKSELCYFSLVFLYPSQLCTAIGSHHGKMLANWLGHITTLSAKACAP